MLFNYFLSGVHLFLFVKLVGESFPQDNGAGYSIKKKEKTCYVGSGQVVKVLDN